MKIFIGGLLLLVSTFLMSSAFATGWHNYKFDVDPQCTDGDNDYTFGNGGYFCTKYCSTKDKYAEKNCNEQLGAEEPRNNRYCDFYKRAAFFFHDGEETELPCEQVEKPIANCINIYNNEDDVVLMLVKIKVPGFPFIKDYFVSCEQSMTVFIQTWESFIGNPALEDVDMGKCDSIKLAEEAMNKCL